MSAAQRSLGRCPRAPIGRAKGRVMCEAGRGTILAFGMRASVSARPPSPTVRVRLSPRVLTELSCVPMAIAVTVQGPPLKWSPLPSMPEVIKSNVSRPGSAP